MASPVNLSIPSPDEDIDLSQEAEQELIQRARISAQLAGYKSIRHFTIAALNGILKRNPVQISPAEPKKK